MPILTVHHVTTYRYRQAVAFGEHRMMLRPRESHDQRLIDAQLDITPKPTQVRLLQDVFGNSVAIARFARRAQELRVDSTVTLDHQPIGAADFHIEEYARTYPFTYDADEMPDLVRSIERQYRDPDHELDRWVRQFLRKDGLTDTRHFLISLTHAIHRNFTYVARAEAGVQPPDRTLRLGSGSCRDFAVLMMEAVRALGLAARFVSGYLYSSGRSTRGHLGGDSTHAWVRVYLPGAGWVEFDPTNGIVGNRDLVRVAIARDPAQAVPLSGTWIGFPSDNLGMNVDVTVTAQAEPVPERAADVPCAGE